MGVCRGVLVTPGVYETADGYLWAGLEWEFRIRRASRHRYQRECDRCRRIRRIKEYRFIDGKTISDVACCNSCLQDCAKKMNEKVKVDKDKYKNRTSKNNHKEEA